MAIFSDTLVFFVNGKKVIEPNPDPQWSLLRYLRDKLRLYGAKNGCSEGGCGACTVMLSRVDPMNGSIINSAIKACLVPLCSLHGTAVVTVEGLGNVKTGLHAIQERIAKSHGTQCGFCTPGFVMSTYALLRNNPIPSEEELEASLHGNLCRCTGYRPILQGLKTFCGAKTCCRNNTTNENEKKSQEILTDPSEFKPYHPTQDPIFPPELKLHWKEYDQPLVFRNENVTWCRPNTLDSLLKLKAEFPFAKLVGGNTEIQLKQCPVYIQIPREISELSSIKEGATHLFIGSRATFSDLDAFCSEQLQSEKDFILYSAILNMLSTLRDVQTRNAATIGGSIPLGNPGSDSNTFFAAVRGVITVQSDDKGERTIALNENFLTPGGGTTINPDEVITSLKLPLASNDEFIWNLKLSSRKYAAVANTFCAVRLRFENYKVAEATVRFDGVTTGIYFAKDLEQYFLGKTFSGNTVNDLVKNAPKLLQKASAKSSLTEHGTIQGILQKLSDAVLEWQTKQPKKETLTFKKASHLFQIVPEDQPVHDLVGRPIVHLPAMKQTTGEAIYANDIPPTVTEAFGAFVLSDKAHAEILRKDYTRGIALNGVLAIYDSTSLPGPKNHMVSELNSSYEFVFAEDEVTFVGQVIAFVVATSEGIAVEAVKLIKIEYQEKIPILTLEEAISKESFISCPMELKVKKGDVHQQFGKGDQVLEGEFRTGGQKHFYMEPNCCIAYPKEDDEVEIVFTTQDLVFAQEAVCHSLGMPANKVTMTTKRLGGGFGGKISRIVFMPVATTLAALDLKRPVRSVLSRADDMKIVGGRHEILCRYKVSFNQGGHISALQADIYCNAGDSTDFTPFVTESALRAMVMAYNIENCEVNGYMCRTNTQSNTAFRSFGACQGALMIENVVEAVADKLGIHSNQIREQHFYQNGEVTPLGHVIVNSNTRRCWEECTASSGYDARVEAVKEFNTNNRFVKRGLALVPLTYLIGFPVPFMNQGGSLVMIYKDGTVALNHGGVEMGQGLQTKMMQIAGRSLGIPITKIRHRDTSTDKVPNTTTSAGSMTTDLNGPAIVEACKILSERLQPFKDANPNGSWEDWVKAAYFARVNLSTTGFNKLEFPGPFNYQVFGTGCTEVEIDCLTGHVSIIRTDIVMDVGESLNPAIDIGQIEGAFVQAMGWVTMEEVGVTPDGYLTATGPSTYKIPGVADIPQEFNVSLLRGSSNPRAVYSSKAIGEPPFLLASSVFFAIKNAVKEARKDSNLDSEFPFCPPATTGKIRIACGAFEGTN